MKYSKIALCGAAITAIATGSSAVAQNNPNAGARSGEIVVTANKREENLNDVGLTITAISGAALEERKITSLADIASVVPGLEYAASANSTPIFTLRGIGFNESSLGVYPAVSVYIDQVPLPFPILAAHSAYDLKRVEVLKGPQGTLFGQNSTGGAINYIAARPTDTLEAGGNISYGRFNAIEGNAYVSGPLSDTMRGRIAVNGLNSDAWQISTTRPGDRNGKQSYVAGRLLLDWDASDSIRFSLNVNGWKDNSEPQAPQFIALRPQDPAFTLPQELVEPLVDPAPRNADWSTGEFEPRAKRNFYQLGLRADIDLTDDITLTSLTSYTHFKQRTTIDSDGTSLILNDLSQNNGKIESFNQELRLANSADNPFRWVIGANYENSKTFEDQILRYIDDSVYNPNNLFINASGVTINQDLKNYAFFGNVEFDVSETITLKGAIRYTNSKNTSRICGYSPGDGAVANLFNLLGTLDAFNPNQIPFDPIGPDDCYTLNNDGIPGTPFINTLKEDNVSWRVGLDYKVNPDVLLYGNVSRGYKAGSFPALAAATFKQLKAVTQESVTAYEAGFKATLIDRKVQLNGAGFYYDYKNKQVRGKTGDVLFGILDILTNVPKSRVFGFESDISIRPIEGLTLAGSVTYLDSKINTFTSFNVLGAIQDFSGEPLPFTPKWNFGLDLDYRHKLANGGAPFFGASLSSHSSSDASPGSGEIEIPVSPVNRTIPDLTTPFKTNAYTTVDARLGYEAPDGQWKVTVWGKNIFNEYYWSNAVIANDSIFRLAGRPRTYGVTFGFKFD